MSPMNPYTFILSKLYFLLVYADGSVNEKEAAAAKHMIKSEVIHENDFKTLMEVLKSKNKEALLAETMIAAKKLEVKQQIRIVAWLCVVANADGFMDRAEWQLIYKIYHKELDLPLHDIFAIQKELNKTIWEQTTLTIL
jgi:uncharacterized tellurite resistance protein B-like protein